MKVNSLNSRVRLTYNGNCHDIDVFESIIDDVNATFGEMGLSAAIVYTHDMPEDCGSYRADLDEDYTIKIWCANSDVACEFISQVTGEE